MRRPEIFAILLACFLLLVPGDPPSNREGIPMGNSVGSRFAGEPFPEEAMAGLLSRHRVPGVSLALIGRGAILWARGYGVCRAGGFQAVNRKTLFQAASISKPVAAAAALRMAEAGRLSLDSDVNRILRSWKVPETGFASGPPVTLRRLLSHSAGLSVWGFPGYPAGAEVPSLLQVLNGEKPANTAPVRPEGEAGQVFRYSGGGYAVVQLLMTEAAGESFPALMREWVLAPAGMRDSTFEQPLPARRAARAATGHESGGEPLEGSWHTYPEMAAAGLWTTPSDLARFAIEIRRSYLGASKGFLSPALAGEMVKRQAGEYGLGFQVPEGRERRFRHRGGNAGYRALLEMSVDSGDGIAVMTNADSGDALIEEILAAAASTRTGLR